MLGPIVLYDASILDVYEGDNVLSICALNDGEVHVIARNGAMDTATGQSAAWSDDNI